MIRILLALSVAATPTLNETTATRPCLSRGEAGALFQVMLPAAVEAAAEKCGDTLPPDAFLRTAGAELAERLRSELQLSPGLLMSAFANFGNEEPPPGLSEQTLQMLSNDIAKGVVMVELKQKDCAAANDLIEAVAPLPSANFAKLMVGLVALAPTEATEDFRICKSGSDD